MVNLDKKYLFFLAILGVIFVGIALYCISIGQAGTSEITANLVTSSSKAGEKTYLAIEVTNVGSALKGGSLTVSSDAFKQATTELFDVSANGSVTVPVNVEINDVKNGQYEVRIFYDNKRVNGDSDALYVIPKIEIVDEHWASPGLDDIAHGYLENSRIGANEQTTFYFKIQNILKSSYSGLTAKITIDAIAVSPTTLPLSPIGPEGKSAEYTFDFQSVNTPPGTYTFTIQLFSEEYEALSETHTLWVIA